MNNNLQQNTPEWLAWRKSKIGASDAPIIMGKSPWKSPIELWEEKLGLRENDFKSAAMQRGIDLEERARESVSKTLRTQLHPAIAIHHEYDYLIASMDGMNLDRSMAVEIKCPGKKNHSKALRGEIPEHYKIQMQHQMMVVGLEKIIYYSYSGKDGVSLVYLRDQALIEEMLEKEHEFYECMISKTPPKNEHDDAWTW